MILDAETLALTPGVERLVAGPRGASFPACSRWSCSPRWSSSRPASARRRRSARGASPRCGRARRRRRARTGSRSPPRGRTPSACPTAQQIAPDPRYLEFVQYAGVSARRQAVCGLHVHVGMPGADECMAAARGRARRGCRSCSRSRRTRRSSPARRPGLMSSRAEVLAQLPRAARRRCSARTRSGRRSSSGSCGSGSRTATRASGGTSGRTRASGRSRCARPTSRPTSS